MSLWIVGITLAIIAAAPLMRRFQPKEARRAGAASRVH